MVSLEISLLVPTLAHLSFCQGICQSPGAGYQAYNGRYYKLTSTKKTYGDSKLNVKLMEPICPSSTMREIMSCFIIKAGIPHFICMHGVFIFINFLEGGSGIGTFWMEKLYPPSGLSYCNFGDCIPYSYTWADGTNLEPTLPSYFKPGIKVRTETPGCGKYGGMTKTMWISTLCGPSYTWQTLCQSSCLYSQCLNPPNMAPSVKTHKHRLSDYFYR